MASRRERAEPAVDFDALLELLLFKILNTSLYIPFIFRYIQKIPKNVLAVRCRSEAGDKRTSASALVTVQSDHSSANEISRRTLHNNIYAMSRHRARNVVTHARYANASETVSQRCGDNGTTMRSHVPQTNNGQRLSLIHI